jgi:hypothetical protein
VAAGAWLPFLPALLLGEVFVARDHLYHFLARRWLLAQGLDGEASLIWNPFEAAGTPFLADPQSGVLYLPAVLVFALLPFAAATVIYLALHVMLAGLGTYGWLRASGSRRGPAALGALAFQWSGFTLSLVDLQNNLCTLAWFPVALLCAERSLRGGTRWPALTALSLAAAFHAGEPQVALVAALAVAGRLLLARRARRRLLPALIRTAGIASLAAALSAALALPLLAHVKETRRADGMPLSLVEQGSLRAVELLDLFSPGLFDSPMGAGMKLTGTQHWIATLYLGWVAIALASWMGRRSLRRVAPWLGLAGVGFLFGMGPMLPMGAWLHEQGVLSWFRYPVRFFFLVLPAVALCAALGSSRLAARIRLGRVPPRRAFAASFAALFIAIAVAAVKPAALGAAAGELGMEMLRGVALAGIVGAWSIACLREERRRRTALAAFACLMALDLLAHDHAGFESAEWRALRKAMALVGAPAARPGMPPPRVLGDADAAQRLDMSGAMLEPIDDAQRAFANLAPGTTGLLGLAELGRDGVYPLRDYEPLVGALAWPRAELDAFVGVELRAQKGVIDRAEVDRSPLRLVRARPGGENLTVVMDALRRPDSLASEGVPVPTDLATRARGACRDEATVELTRWRAHDLTATVTTDCEIVLVHLQSLAPGWRAEIDGEPAPLAPALGAYQAVGVPPGMHEVRFVHAPPGFKAALPVSLSALIVAAVLVVLERRPRGWRAGSEH